jgi:hypothetical protein
LIREASVSDSSEKPFALVRFGKGQMLVTNSATQNKAQIKALFWGTLKQN